MNYNVISAMHSNVWLFHMLVWFVRQQLVSVVLLMENFMLVAVASLTKLAEQDLNLHLVCSYLLKNWKHPIVIKTILNAERLSSIRNKCQILVYHMSHIDSTPADIDSTFQTLTPTFSPHIWSVTYRFLLLM